MPLQLDIVVVNNLLLDVEEKKRFLSAIVTNLALYLWTLNVEWRRSYSSAHSVFVIGEYVIGRVIKAMHANWHPGCFRCELCKDPLADTGFIKNAGRFVTLTLLLLSIVLTLIFLGFFLLVLPFYDLCILTFLPLSGNKNFNYPFEILTMAQSRAP